jgi:plasmid stabilization system protein ParE
VISIRWSTRAADEFEALIYHINEDNPEAALSMAQNVLNRASGTAHKTGDKQPGQPDFKFDATASKLTTSVALG